MAEEDVLSVIKLPFAINLFSIIVELCVAFMTPLKMDWSIKIRDPDIEIVPFPES